MKIIEIGCWARFLVVLAVCVLVVGATGHYILAQTQIQTKSCVYTYGAWGDCNANGRQTRTVASTYPSGVNCSNVPITEQSCTYVASVFSCTGYNYSDWSGCKSDGTQTRSVVSSTPSGCFAATAGSAIPETSRTCIVCAYNCGDWSVCASGVKARTCSFTPTNCVAPDDKTQIPATQQNCAANTVICTSYTYGDWSGCASGTQTKSIISQYPAGCILPSEVLETVTQSCIYNSTTTAAIVPCTYTYGLWSTGCNTLGYRTRPYAATPAGCSQTTAPYISESCNAIACSSYVYSDWSACASSGTQTRTILTKLPAECTGTSSAVLSQTCVYSVPCASYTYDAWSACSSGGVQTRSIIGKSPAGCVDSDNASLAAILKQACAILPCASYTYSDWGECNADGKQERKIVDKFPAGCGDAKSAELNQPCVCKSYTYSEWSECSESGTQSRKILTKEPAGCVDGANQELTRSCAYLPCKSYAYGEWSDCDSLGKQSRKVILSAPAGCSGGAVPELKRGCLAATGTACAYTYSEWDNCRTSGTQTRKLVSRFPEICIQKELPVLEQKCDYVPAAVAKTSVPENENGAVLTAQKEPCVYSYSAWGACVAGRQTRMVVIQSPAGCDESAVPELTGDCAAAQSILPPTLADAPVPVPESMLVAVPEVAAPANLNGRTDSGWQKYYFGSPDCQSADVCGGIADPDNDGLNNNDEYRFGTNPKSSDTDLDGLVDGYEILNGRNPLAAETSVATDAVVYESPKEAGQELNGTYQVSNIAYDAAKKELTISGKALPDSYVTVYIYSDPVVLTIKTDSEGNWSYVLDKPMEDGRHEVYVAVNDNNGKVIAKSAPLPFVQTAEAATVIPAMAATEDRAPAPTKARLWEGYLIFFGAGIGGMLLALAAIGLARNIGGSKTENKQ